MGLNHLTLWGVSHKMLCASDSTNIDNRRKVTVLPKGSILVMHQLFKTTCARASCMTESPPGSLNDVGGISRNGVKMEQDPDNRQH